jgi:hypothetical protein
MFNVSDSRYGFENVTLIVRNVMSLQKLKVLLLERLSAMMRLLIENVFGNPIKVRMRDGKRAVAFLPGKMTADPSLLVDVISWTRF